MEVHPRLVGDVEDADEVDRVLLEDLVVGDRETLVLRHELGSSRHLPAAAAERPVQHAVEHRQRLGVLLLSAAQKIRVRSPTSLATRK